MSTTGHQVKQSFRVREPARQPHPGQQAAASVGAVFLLVGLLGFVPGITSGLGSMAFAGPDSGALLLGAFQVSVLHNLLHLGFGVAGLWLAKTLRGARQYLMAGGLVYVALWLYGSLIDLGSGANFVPVNTPDNWLNLAFGGVMLLLSVLTIRAFGKARP